MSEREQDQGGLVWCLPAKAGTDGAQQSTHLADPHYVNPKVSLKISSLKSDSMGAAFWNMLRQELSEAAYWKENQTGSFVAQGLVCKMVGNGLMLCKRRAKVGRQRHKYLRRERQGWQAEAHVSEQGALRVVGRERHRCLSRERQGWQAEACVSKQGARWG